MHSYQHNIKTFNNATRHLTPVQRMFYRELIELYYDTEKPLSNDLDGLCWKVMASTDEEKEAVELVLKGFFVLTGKVWTHDYCDEVIEKFQSNQSAQARAGRASGEVRRKKAEERKRKRTSVNHSLNIRSTDVEHSLNIAPTEGERNRTEGERNRTKPETIKPETIKPYTEEQLDLLKPPSPIKPKSPRKKPKFQKPTLEQVQTHFIACGFPGELAPAEAEKLMDHYEERGWTYGKNNRPVKFWKARVKIWVRSWEESQERRGGGNGSSGGVEGYAGIIK